MALARDKACAVKLRTRMKPLPSRAGLEATTGATVTATNVRWVVLSLMFILSMVTYLDRVNISIAARYMTVAYGLTDVQMGKIFSAFILAYGLFQLPGGWLGDRYGPRIVLTAAIVWWSIFTALTAVVADAVPRSVLPVVVSLFSVRFLMGAGEAAAWPNFNRTIANWMAVKDRALASSLPLAGGGLGAALTPPFIAWVMLTYGWKGSFYLCGLIGIVAAVAWYLYARDTPEKHPGVNAAELKAIRSGSGSAMISADASPHLFTRPHAPRTPWRAIFTEPNVWLLFCSAATCGYLVYIYMTWFYVYLVEARGLSRMRGSFYTAGPFIAIALMTPIGGVLGDRVTRRFGKTVGRRLVSMAGMFIAGLAVFSGVLVTDIHIAIIGLSIGGGAIYFALSSHWAATIDISKEHAGTVSGVMNWGGNIGGMASPILTPILARKLGWAPALEIAGLIILVGGTLWLFIKPERQLQSASGE